MSEKITLKAARVNAGLTQKEVAEKMGVSTQTINKWENNLKIVKLGSFNKLCKLYNKNVNEIFLIFKLTFS